ncbi:hypothetical protein [Candidatus Nitronereus thalassa]|uniref:Uncharacterized protein n=1 Tax=Candidatus Nitronereus thalassa TaxID=3020898 RepID=A0ABU3K7D6_9BACT|nr:hypothetical protein [Candidatus Nitronereus thalassa]MDT7042304.1 hypothetical protein [Candidatus Nitronereus thalassa]
MKVRTTGLAVLAAIALVGGMASSAFAIEAFQERFEWGDLSKPTTLHARVAVVDPYDKAAWVNVAVFGGNAESGYYWQKYFPGKNLKVYAGNDAVWSKLQSLGKDSHSQAVMTGTQASKYTLVELTVQETEQNHRVVSAIKEIPEIAGSPDKPRSIHSLRSIGIVQSMDNNSWQQNRKMRYDVMIPGGETIVGVIPNSNQNPNKSKGTATGEFGASLQ